MKQKKKGYLFAAATSVCFGLNGVGIRHLFLNNNELSIEAVVVWGFLGALLLVSPYYIFSNRGRSRMASSLRQDGKTIFLISALTAFGGILWIFAIKFAPVSVVSLLAKTIILHSAVFGFFLLGEKFTIYEGIGFALAIPGVLLISTLDGQVEPLAVAAILFSAFIYAIQSLIVKRFAPSLYGLEFTILRASSMLIIYIIFFISTGGLKVVSMETFLALGVISLTGLIFGRAFYFEAHKHLEISKLNMALLLEPVFVLLMAALLLGEPLSTKKVGGALFILVGLGAVIGKNFQRQAALIGGLHDERR